MKDPIKIIHKFKNNNRRIQYKVFIFLGSSISEEILKILEIIEKKDFFNTLLILTLKNYKILEEYYGEKWFEKFFISHHLKSQIKQIETIPAKRKQIETKYGTEWFKKNINMESIKKIKYSFATNYYDNVLEKKKEIIQKKFNQINFKTHSIFELSGGNDDELADITDDNIIIKHKRGDADDGDDDEEEPELTNEILDEIIEDEFDLDELANLYNNENIEDDKVIKETSKLIGEALNDKKWEKKIEEIIIPYDKSLDNITFDTNIEDVFIKYYITEEYIFKDDTIRNIRQKICISIPLPDYFGKSVKLVPESQYFWSEYLGPKGKDEIMIGQKWIRRNELVKIDIQPNENLKIYEKLRNNLSHLKNAFGYKLKREDDDTNILRFYEDFMTLNEIYMIDIFNELGINYSSDSESKRNLFEVYVNIYFPIINYDRFESIINLLNGKNMTELNMIESEFLLIKNDNKLEKEIYTIVEDAKNNLTDFNQYFAENYIIQSNIHVNINNPNNLTGTISDTKYNLYRIFDNFIINQEYPFIQYQTSDGNITYKLFTKFKNVDNQIVLAKWFENPSHGISFKVSLPENKFITITLQESGRIEYKITWKEDDNATIKNIIESYEYIKNLLKKINDENKKIKFMMPTDDRFKYAFINTIQKFTLPENFKINHNDLSEFCRFFFPYIALVIEPKKRVSKKNDKQETGISKYGTYLRYKRISKYENRTKMHLRILYFLRNFELNDRQLLDEIAKQFNITLEQTVKEIDFVRTRYGKIIQKSGKVLKKLKELPKSKPPGIGIDIQGRDRERYKIRITGARTKDQLIEIVDFIKVLIYLYSQTYLYKKKEYQKLKETLKILCKIAKRRYKVSEIVNYEVGSSTVKMITSLDKKRLGFKPEKGQSQWTRSCQNSGTDKKRRPTIIDGNSVEKLVKDNYKLNEKTGYYEKKVEIIIKKKKYEVVLKAIKLTGEDNMYNFYTCDPTENNEFMHIGFLSRGNNPSDLCMPCCFKKDQLFSANKKKQNYYLRCIGEQQKPNNEDLVQTHIGDKLYILQETNKIQDNRFIYLPKYLDILFNKLWKSDHKIKNHYLYESKSGYFFKYTVKNEKYYFLGALSNIYEKSIDDIIKLAVDFLEKDKKDIYFTFLNNGDIKTSFKTKENYINYLKTSSYLEYDVIGELLALPNLLSKKGIYYYILDKNILTVKKVLEKDNIIEKYFLNCLNYENNWMMNEDRDIIFLLKEIKFYFPIYRVQKDEVKDKKIKLLKLYDINFKETNNIISELKNYYSQSCSNKLYSKIIGNFYLFAKNIILLLKNKNIEISKQIIDDRNKCKYILLTNNLLLPVYPSGISYDYNYDYINNFKQELETLESVLVKIKKINENINMEYIPKIIFYDNKEKNNVHIISLLLENELILPIKFDWKTEKYIKSLGIALQFQPLEEEIDKEIMYNKNKLKASDSRLVRVKQHMFRNESYNIFRLELSLFLQENSEIRDKIIILVTNNKIKVEDKKFELRKLLFKIINVKLVKELKGGSFVHTTKEIKDIENYNISNLREYCEISKTKDKCETNLHCAWTNNTCKIRLDENMIIDFVNKVLEEFIQMDIQFKELIQEDEYYVSDIVDYSQYTNRSNQQIIKTSNYNIEKIMNELFGKEKIPIIGRKELSKKNNEAIIEDYLELSQLGKQFIQPIISNQDSIIRSFVNCYYWINNTLYDIESRNLGYLSQMQTTLTNQLKAKIIDFILKMKTEQNNKYFKNNIGYFNEVISKFRKNSYNTDGKLELYILSFILDNRIVIYNNYNNVIGLYLQGEVEITNENIKTFTSEQFRNKTIFIKMEYDGSNTIPKNIYSIYYL